MRQYYSIAIFKNKKYKNIVKFTAASTKEAIHKLENYKHNSTVDLFLAWKVNKIYQPIVLKRRNNIFRLGLRCPH